MARKSRKAQAQGKPVAEVKKEAAALPTAIYARLSVENSGKDDDGSSLQNQIAVCKDYLERCPCLRLTEVYSDNGKNRDRVRPSGVEPPDGGRADRESPVHRGP